MNNNHVTFWGVRGTCPVSGDEHAYYGGDTCCVSVVSKTHRRFIVDAGSGIRSLGAYMEKHHERQATIVISHAHWDHVCGLPFFAPLMNEECEISIAMAGEGKAEEIFNSLFDMPFFPLAKSDIRANVDFIALPENGNTYLNGVELETCPLHHPGGSTGFRINNGQGAIAYIVDHEHCPKQTEIDRRIHHIVQNADMLIYDATYDQNEYNKHRGWGHSTAEEGARIAKEFGVSQLALIHHAPEHDDNAIDEILKTTKRIFENSFAAKQGQTLCFA